MKILIDADGCPVTDITIRAAREKSIECLLFCDTSHVLKKEGAHTITVSKGADSVDFALVNLIQAGDLVITQDYGLAAMCLVKKATVLHQDGFLYREDNIEGLLHSRFVANKVRRAGVRLKGPTKRTKEQNVQFECLLQSLLAQQNNS